MVNRLIINKMYFRVNILMLTIPSDSRFLLRKG